MAARNRPSRGAREDEDFAQRIDRAGERVAAAEPGGDRLAEAIGAGIGRIAAEIRNMRGEDRPDEGRNRVLRLADRDVDRGLARLDAGQKLGEPHERRACVSRPSGEVSRVR